MGCGGDGIGAHGSLGVCGWQCREVHNNVFTMLLNFKPSGFMHMVIFLIFMWSLLELTYLWVGSGA